MQMAVLKPSRLTFQKIADDPRASWGRAITWVTLAAIIAFVLQLIVQLATMGMEGMASLYATEIPVAVSAGGFLMISLLCGTPIVIIAAMLGFVIQVGVSDAFARMMGGLPNQGKAMAMSFAAFIAPLSIVSSGVGLIPCIGTVISLGLSIYLFVLMVIATQTIHNLGTGKAILANIILPAILFLLAFVLVCGVLVLLGPAIADVFQNILNDPQYFTY